MLSKVLVIIDDNEQLLYQLKEELDASYQLLSVSQGQRALELSLRIRFSFIIVSRWLSDCDSLDIVAKLKKTCPAVPVLFIGEQPSCNFILDVWHNGANDFLSYPFNKSDLETCLLRILPRKADADAKRREVTPPTKSKRKRLFKFSWPEKRIEPPANESKELEIPPQQVPETPPFSTEKKTPKVQEEPDGSARISVNFLGNFRISLNDQPVSNWPGKKAKLLCAYLFLHKRPVYRDKLMDMFWPDAGTSSARNCLNVTLHQVRASFQEIDQDVTIIQFKDDCYCINPDIEITRDIDVFKSHWRRAKTFDNEKKHFSALPEYELAAAVYKGDFMEEEVYERWIDNERESLKESYLLILDRISYFYSTNGKPDVAIDLCDQILKKDECREDIHRRLMKCFFRIGQPQRALKQFEKCTKALEDELEVKPTKKTIELYEMIKNRLN